MQYQVMRPFNGGGRSLKAGDVIDDDGWPVNRAAQLVAQRYLMPAGLAPGDAPTPRLGTRSTRPGGGRAPKEARA